MDDDLTWTEKVLIFLAVVLYALWASVNGELE